MLILDRLQAKGVSEQVRIYVHSKQNDEDRRLAEERVATATGYQTSKAGHKHKPPTQYCN